MSRIKVAVVNQPVKVVTINRGPRGARGADTLTADQIAAIQAADTPSALNPMATMEDFHDIGYLKFDTAVGAPADTNPGVMYWDPTDLTLSLIVNGATMQIGQEFYIKSVNKTGAPIPNGTPVSIAGAQGNRPKIAPTDVSSVASAKCFIGITTEEIADNAEGFVTRLGLVRTLDTSAFLEGDRLWVTGIGGITNVEPETGIRLLVGLCVISSNGNGQIYSNPRHFELTAEQQAGINAAYLPSDANPFITSLAMIGQLAGYTTFQDMNYVGMWDRGATMSFVDGTRTFTIDYGAFTLQYFAGNTMFSKTGPQSIQIPNTIGLHFIYWNGSVLSTSTTPWDLTGNAVPVATVYWDGTVGWIGEERHCPRNQAARRHHLWMHSTIGARYSDGMAGTFTNTTLSIAAGAIFDEDIELRNAGALTSCRVIARSALSQAKQFAVGAKPYGENAGVLAYDNGTGTLAQVPASSYVLNAVYATNDIAYPIYVVVGQSTASNITAARALPTPIPTNITTREWKLLYTVIYRNVGGTATFIEAADYRTVQSLPGGIVSSLPAASVVVTPVGGISSVNAQGAFEEVDLDARHETIAIACSDETTALTTGTAKVTFAMPYAFSLTEVQANVNTAPTGANLIVDINEGGVSILSTKLSIDAGEKNSTTAATPAVISDTELAAAAEITIDIDQVGSTVAGKGLKVYLLGQRV